MPSPHRKWFQTDKGGFTQERMDGDLLPLTSPGTLRAKHQKPATG